MPPAAIATAARQATEAALRNGGAGYFGRPRMSAEFFVESHFEISGRGAFVVGQIRAGTIRVGDLTSHEGKTIAVSAVEFADNISTQQYWVCLAFNAFASRFDLENAFPRGSVIKLQTAV